LGTSVAETGTPADGAIKALCYDVPSSTLIVDRTLRVAHQDDHTSPSVLALGDEVQVSWALHRPVDYLDISTTNVSGAYSTQRIHRPKSIVKPGRGMSYCSVHIVDGNRWLLYRGEKFSWNLMTSPDGKKWTPLGLVVTPGTLGDRPYIHAASDGNRLHLLVTNGNPTEYRGTCAYAGTISKDLTIKRADGKVIGKVGDSAPKPAAFTRLAVGVKGANETYDTDMWLSDLKIVDGRPTGVLSRRDRWPAGSQAVGSYRHRYYWIRQRPEGWLVEPLCPAGSNLYDGQPDYSGLVAQDPSEPKRVVASTNVHPVTGAPLVSNADGRVHWELFEGYRVAERQWSWVALTENSTEDNLRPVIASGGTYKTLAWMRGEYRAWTAVATRIIIRQAVAVPPYPPASLTSPSVTSGGEASPGPGQTAPTPTPSVPVDSDAVYEGPPAP
jgi:hypothetical protein